MSIFDELVSEKMLKKKRAARKGEVPFAYNM